MTRTSLFACLEPRRSEWQLGALPPATGRMMLVGWKKDPEPVDGGVPEDVAPVLARAFTSMGRITFLSSAVHASTGSGWWPWKRAPGPTDLTSTTDPQTLMQAFDDATHPWSMQGQVLLISTSEDASPGIDRKQLLAVLENEWSGTANQLSSLGVIGVVRPGVDGDLAGLLTLTADARDSSLAALERETRRASFDWSVLSEEAFAERYAS
jgi:hypothetical protein